MKTLPLNKKLSNTSAPFPNDLRGCLPERELLMEVYSAVEKISAQGFPKVFNEIPVPMLRTLLIYAYATGVFGSKDIEEGIRSNATLKYISSGHSPTWETIRQFRKLQSSSILKGLEELLIACSSRNAQDLECYAFCSMGRITSRMDAVMTRSDAAFRLQSALQADSADMDF